MAQRRFAELNDNNYEWHYANGAIKYFATASIGLGYLEGHRDFLML